MKGVSTSNILPLCTYNSFMDQKKQISKCYFTIPLNENYKFELGNIHDVVNLEYFRIKRPYQIISYSFYIKYNLFLYIDFNFLKNVFPDTVTMDDDGYDTYKLHIEKFLKHDYLYARDLSIVLSISGDNQEEINFEDIKLYGTAQFLQVELRNKLFTTDTEYKIYQLQTHQHKNISNNYVIEDLDFFVSNGIFIETSNNNLIESIKLSINYNQTIYDLDKFQINKYCKKYGNMIYLNFTNNDNIWNDNYDQALCMAHMDSIKLEIRFENPVNYVNIYNISPNRLRYINTIWNTTHIYKLNTCIESSNSKNNYKNDNDDIFEPNNESFLVCI